MAWFSFFIKRKDITVHPTDTRLEIVSEGLTQASAELQQFVKILKARLPETPK